MGVKYIIPKNWHNQVLRCHYGAHPIALKFDAQSKARIVNINGALEPYA